MLDYRRFRVPGGTYFFTINLLERRSDLLIRHMDYVHVNPVKHGHDAYQQSKRMRKRSQVLN